MKETAIIGRDLWEFMKRLSTDDKRTFLVWVIEYQLYDRMPEDDGSQLYNDFKKMLADIDAFSFEDVESETGGEGE